MNTELWTINDSGVLRITPFLLKVCRANAFGSRYLYEGGAVENALFTYLSGKPDIDFFEEHRTLFFGRYLVCMNAEWELFLKSSPYLDKILLRRMFKPFSGRSIKMLLPLPRGYELCSFDKDAFYEHPFGHGANYTDHSDFLRRGSGAVVRYGKEIVSSASGFLTYENEVEMDISTVKEHRRKGLADHCTSMMLEDCASRGIIVHWDAQ
ncbi:MAG: GNAT family N-acetyltransferase, partial [Ruminiclostridium sp.]|nr:GNAT family N-acetyltransferase [Ruminiclostridium sp.]